MIIIGSPGSPTAGRAARPVAEPDRIVVTVAVDSTSPPTEGRYLNRCRAGGALHVNGRLRLFDQLPQDRHPPSADNRQVHYEEHLQTATATHVEILDTTDRVWTIFKSELANDAILLAVKKS